MLSSMPTSNMLTSSAYLNPDYLHPLPTTLDAKKSPLALLAQTCSSIGKDTTPSKPIIPPLEKKDVKKEPTDRKSCSPKSKSGDEKCRPSSVKREVISPGSGGGETGASGFRSPLSKDSSGGAAHHSTSGSRSPGDYLSERRRPSVSPHHQSDRDTSSASSANGGHSHSSSKISLSCGNISLEVNQETSTSATSTSSSHRTTPPRTTTSTSVASTSASSAPLATSVGSVKDSLYPGGALPSALGGLPGCGSLPGMLGHHPYAGLDHLQALHAVALAKHHGGPLAGTAAISPYSYTRVKTATGATTLVPVCRDPFCTNCQLSSMQGLPPPAHHHPLGAPCPAGCLQCSHDKSGAAAAAAAASVSNFSSSLPSPLSSLPGSGLHLPGSLPTSSASSLSLPSSLYPHAFGIIPGQHQMLYQCNWVQAGSDYCGKRFATSEELLQHLRTHTSAGDASSLAAGLSAYNHALGLSAQSAAAAAAAAASMGVPPLPLPPTPGSLSPNSALRHAYPRSLSPNSLLSASRYHPYKSPLSTPPGLPPTAAALSGLPNPLGPYYSPYTALYGPRLGAAVAP